MWHELKATWLEILTCTIKTSSLELHQISNFLLSPLAFSVMPTALIWERNNRRTHKWAPNLSPRRPNTTRTWQTQAYTEGVLEAVGRSLLVALPILLPPLAEEESLLMQEQVPLHGLESSQVLDLGVTFLVLRPHTEGALHQQAAQLWQIALNSEETGIYDQVWKPIRPVKKGFYTSFLPKPTAHVVLSSRPIKSSYLISCDGDEVHWVIDSFQDPKNGGESFL